ncbi:class I SAM-dependent methyltransferase [Pseudomonas aeruginosa]|uniref:class I SAM-dependent methyltransferase n=1 Tax=Pseudomonas aeruginosa TaxID=287 RepID=UPI00071B029E|nr:class I SAM-dependent methyltransferase [Pseudomonas aeruginosa]KSK82073.1 SAM-dependent methyltransferase [Pseudomonas aeruginosa]
MSEREHWQRVYESKPSDAVSWFQAEATLSLDLIRRIGAPREAAIIDVGGGASTLVDGLLAEGFGDLTVLDLSDAALRVARNRLGARGEEVRWIAGDITGVDLLEATYDVWHDRAVFHFLTTAEARRAYVRQVMKAVRHGGHVIVATFAADGPTECSGLPVMRYDADELHAEFGSAFQLTEHRDEHHVTPAGRVQHFVYCHCLKRL